jgi:hypothetical protein|uniref:CRISPR system precrRNA processing endoribonuclease RAMP protein Cas6 n=1 Tax=Desulfobacca acetoxidans TaxID=60893 RepID=A0A7V6A377_9BACT
MTSEAPFVAEVSGTDRNEQPLLNLSFSSFTAIFEVTAPVSLPRPFTGSTFHGVLGWSLAEVRPDQARPRCRQCPCRSECRFSHLQAFFFQAPAEHPFLREGHEALPPRYRRSSYPPPYLLEPPPGGDYAPGDLLPLTFTLVGRAILYLPFMLCALRGLAARFLGSKPGRVRLVTVTDALAALAGEDTLIYEGHSDRLLSPGRVLNLPSISAQSPSGEGPHLWTIRFLTPFSYKHDDRPGGKPTFPLLLRNLLRRFTFLTVYSPLSHPIDYPFLLEQAEAVATHDDSRLGWQKHARFSSRTEERMKYHGWVGDIAFKGPLPPFRPYLKLGEFLHVGKMVSFGLGQYALLENQ